MAQASVGVLPGTPVKTLGTNDDCRSIVIIDEALKGSMEFQYEAMVLYNMRSDFRSRCRTGCASGIGSI
jgi:hypothetical protein